MLLIGIVLAIAIALLFAMKCREGFQNPADALSTNPLNQTGSLQLLNKTMHIDFISDIASSPSLMKTLGTTRVIVNDVDLLKIKTPTILQSPISKGFFLAMVPLSKAGAFKCPFDLANKTVAFFDRCDYHFIKAILLGYRINESSVTLRELTYDEIVNTSSFLAPEIDIIITSVAIDSKYHSALGRAELEMLSFDKIDLDRLSLFYPNLKKTEVSRNDIIRPSINWTSKSPSLTLVENSFHLIDLAKRDLAAGSENFISKLQFSSEALDPRFGCYGDLLVESKAYCNSKYNVVGELKPNITVWDQKCEKDTDCPFFKANTHYPNERGGCSKGFCEFPVGVQRASFMKYNNEGGYAPFCYGCENTSPDCCNEQEQPDYAFVNDSQDRKKHGLSVVVKRI